MSEEGLPETGWQNKIAGVKDNQVVNMACPSCGGQSTEYDEHKWTCLRCGNKFIYAPASSAQTQNYVQNTVNVVGQPTYELDIQNSKPAKPIKKTRYENAPENFSYLPMLVETRDTNSRLSETLRKRKTQNEYVKAFWLFAVILFSIVTIVGIGTKSWLMIACVLPALVSLFVWFLAWEETNNINSQLNIAEMTAQSTGQQITELEDFKNEEIIISYQSVCPFCMAHVANPSSGLTHCLKCGKQFHYSNERSYPVKFK